MRYGVFKGSYGADKGPLNVLFQGFPNPANPEEILSVNAEDEAGAANKAQLLLETLGVKTHTIIDDPAPIRVAFADFFVAKLPSGHRAHRTDVFQVYGFVPVHRG